MKTSGYSGTPLLKKLGIKNDFKVKLVNEPGNYFELLGELPENINLQNSGKNFDFIHYFCTSLSQLKKDLPKLRTQLAQDGMIWISWLKKKPKVVTDVHENLVRELALQNDLVDVKVCAIDDDWSGLKLVIRIKDRK